MLVFTLEAETSDFVPNEDERVFVSSLEDGKVRWTDKFPDGKSATHFNAESTNVIVLIFPLKRIFGNDYVVDLKRCGRVTSFLKSIPQKRVSREEKSADQPTGKRAKISAEPAYPSSYIT